MEGGKKIGKNSEDKKEENVKDTQEKQSSKKKGKGKKGKKGKGRGKKSHKEASEKDKTALKEFLDSLKGTRRLMVRTLSFVCPYFILLSLILIHTCMTFPSSIWSAASVCVYVVLALVDLNAHHRCNAIQPAEGRERKATL